MGRLDPDRRAFRRSIARAEAPQVLLWSALTTAGLTALYALAFPYSAEVLALHVLEVALFLVGAWVASRPRTPDAAIPWILVVCAWGIVGGFLLENLWEASAIGMVFLVIILVAFGSFVFDFIALVVASVPMVIGVALVAAEQHPEDGPRWAVVALSAILLGGMLRFLRLRAFDQLRQALADNARLATTDPLTGCLNRRGLDERLPGLVGLAHRSQQHVFVAIIDIDGLKAVNDNHGHGAGDAVIARVAAALREVTRHSDLLARWGGDEFLLVGMGESPDAGYLLDRVRASVLEGAPLEQVWTGAVSVGSASGSPADFDFGALVQLADDAMYEHRRQRRA